MVINHLAICSFAKIANAPNTNFDFIDNMKPEYRISISYTITLSQKIGQENDSETEDTNDISCIRDIEYVESGMRLLRIHNANSEFINEPSAIEWCQTEREC